MIATPRLVRVPPLEHGITLGDFLVPIRVGERATSRQRHVALVVLGALFIALTANIRVPVPGSPVPITGQTFSVLLVGGALGLRRGLLSVVLYLLMGLVLPVYANSRSGIGTIASLEGGQVVLGATGGYLLAFIAAAALVGWLAELGWDRRVWSAAAALAVGNVVIYLVGVPWLAAALNVPLTRAIELGLLPFLPGDLLKLAVAAALLPAGWWLVRRGSTDGRRTES